MPFLLKFYSSALKNKKLPLPSSTFHFGSIEMIFSNQNVPFFHLAPLRSPHTQFLPLARRPCSLPYDETPDTYGSGDMLGGNATGCKDGTEKQCMDSLTCFVLIAIRICLKDTESEELI